MTVARTGSILLLVSSLALASCGSSAKKVDPAADLALAKRAVLVKADLPGYTPSAGRVAPPRITVSLRLEVDFLTADMAEMATWLRGVERAGPRTTVIEGDDAHAAFRAFIATVYLTRQSEGR